VGKLFLELRSERSGQPARSQSTVRYAIDSHLGAIICLPNLRLVRYIIAVFRQFGLIELFPPRISFIVYVLESRNVPFVSLVGRGFGSGGDRSPEEHVERTTGCFRSLPVTARLRSKFFITFGARRAMGTPLKNGYAYAHEQCALPYGRGSVAVAVHVFHHFGWPARAMGTPFRSRLGTRARFCSHDTMEDSVPKK